MAKASDDLYGRRLRSMPTGTYAGTVESGGGPPHDVDMNERVAKLEQRLDSVVPSLATKSDLEGLRTEIVRMSSDVTSALHSNHTEIQRWMIATIIALFLGMVGWGSFLSSGIKASIESLKPAQASMAPLIIQIPAAPAAPLPSAAAVAVPAPVAAVPDAGKK